MRYGGAVALFMILPSISRGQSSSSKGSSLHGRVVDSLTRAPIVGASVEIAPTNQRQLTDSGGRFAFASPAPGPHALRVRHLGYVPARESVFVTGSDSLEQLVTLSRLPAELREVVISGQQVVFPRFFEDAYKRAARGAGVYFTREYIDELNSNDYKSLLERIPGVSANDRGVTFNRCQSGLEAAQNPRARPKVQVYIDGHRMALDADDFRGIHAAMSSVKPRQLQLMEVYPNVSSIPAEFLEDACAVVVIWTRKN